MTKRAMSVNELLNEIGFKNFISNPTELQNITEHCKKVIEAQQGSPDDKAKQITRALSFSQALWEKYDCAEIAELYKKFQRIEEALFGLERDEISGARYREHFIHMFNCYIFGLRIITSLLEQTNDSDAKRIFKVQDEKLREVGLPFGDNYSYRKRLFYLWTLISTFHDIAIPFQHLKNIGSGINRFVQEFGWEFTNPHVSIRSYDASQLHYYFDLLGRLYGGGLTFSDHGRKYTRQATPHYYISKILGREFDCSNHGVLSGFFMWKTIEEIFLVSRTSKYKFNVEQFNKYSEYVLEQDIARAALAISLHSLKHDKRSGFVPRVFPIKFSEMPLTFLLILSDELQEYFRWEGVTVQNKMRFACRPRLTVCCSNEKDNMTIRVSVTFSWEEQSAKDVISQAKTIVEHNNIDTVINDIDEAADVIGNGIKDTLQKKLHIGEEFCLSLGIFVDWKRQIYGKEFMTGA